MSVQSKTTPIKISLELLCCPICNFNLGMQDSQLVCLNLTCKTTFPIIEGVPILLNEAHSLFSLSDFSAAKSTTLKSEPKLLQYLRRLIPDNSINLKAEANYKELLKLLLESNSAPKVLVVGGSLVGAGLNTILSYPSIELIETDVALGGQTGLVCDAHNLPFVTGSFDAVIIQAVLEHVVDPYRCVNEIHRVLKKNGLVYAETPFMQQVHLGRYDFTRFTHLGHRRLFRYFEELSSGAMCGPGMALAWAYEYFLLSFVKAKPARVLVRGFARLTGFWLKYFDRFLINKPGALDAASGFYFLGRKSDQALSDRKLIQLYQGAMD